MLTLIIVTVTLLAVLALGACAAWTLAWRTQQRQLAVMTERLLTEQRMDAATRSTLAAMRAAVRSRST